MSKSTSKSKPVPATSKGGAGAAAAPKAGRGNAAAQSAMSEQAGQFAPKQPYTSKYGANRGDAFSVDEGQLTFDAEGTEKGRFHSRTAHVPPGPSGVTIGRGYDLGQHTRATIIAAMTAAGLSPSVASSFAAAAGLKGDDARRWLKKHRSSLPEITAEQQESLFEATYAEMSADVERISGKADVVKKYGATDMDELNPHMKDVLVDLRYRGDYTGGAREKLQGAAASEDLIGMTDSLTDRKQWKGVPQDRFERRAAWMREAEEQAEGEAYGFTGMPMERGQGASLMEARRKQAKSTKKAP